MLMPDVPSKLFTAFNDVTYYDEPHKYFVDGKELISVTTLLGKYVDEFNEGYWAGVKSKQFDVPSKDVKHGWKYINRVGTERGSIIHDYAENLYNNKVFPYERDRVVTMFGSDPLRPSYKKVKSHVEEFYRHTQGRLIPIKTELVVFDREYGIGGMVDLLFWNVLEQEFQIWDWKTNKDFEGWNPITKEYETEEGKSNFKGPLALLKDNDINHYSLQLDTYKHIIEKNTGIKLGKSYLIWVSHLQDRFYTIETLNRRIYVKKMIDSYNNVA